MAVDDTPTLSDAQSPPAGNAFPEAQAGDYPALFRALLVRSVESALASIAPDDLKLDDDARERSLYALSLALDLAEAWPAASQLLLTIAPHMEMQGYWREWLEFLARALERATQFLDLSAAARVHLHLGLIQQAMGDCPSADQHYAQCEKLARCSGDRRLAAKALDRMADLAVKQTDFVRARRQAVQVIEDCGSDDYGSAAAYSILGFIAYQQGEWTIAIDCYSRSLELHQSGANPRFVAQAARNLALAYRGAGRHQDAGAFLEDTISAFATLVTVGDSFAAMGSVVDEADARMNLGVEYWYMGQYKQALECYAQCEPVFAKNSQSIMLARLANNRGLVYLELGDYMRAESEFALGVALARSAADRCETAEILESWGGMHWRMGHTQAAIAKWREALTELDDLREPPRYLYCLLLRKVGEACPEYWSTSPAHMD